MKKQTFFLFLLCFSIGYAQTSRNSTGTSQWTGESRNLTDAMGAEVLGTGRTDFVAPILMPATGRSWVPGGETNWVPIVEGNEPLNLAPSDTQAFILYQRATSAFRSGDGRYPDLYRELIRRFPTSSYTPYAIYSLAAIETDYRMKIRMLLTLKENNKNFVHMNKVLETLGDIYYVVGAPEAAKEVFLEAASSTAYSSPYSSYMLAVLTLDSSRLSGSADSKRRTADDALRGAEAIKHVRKYIASQPNPENTYRAYILYAEALLLQQRYPDALTVLSNAAPLRPWAYDNGLNILLYAGEAYYFEGKKLYDRRDRSYATYYNKSLYAFSLLRLRFSRSAEAKVADQFIASLERGNALNAQPEPWIARSFETVIKARPEVRFEAPVYGPGRYPLTNLPGSITPPATDFTYLGDMPKPRPNNLTGQEFYIPALPQRPEVTVLTFTNRVTVPVTNNVTNIITNRIFAMYTNVVTNQFASVFQTYTTNVINSTNYMLGGRPNATNNVTNYELIPVFVTNEISVKTNTLTNIIDVYITNTASELVVRDITNLRPSFITNTRTNIIDVFITNQGTELVVRNTQRTNMVPVYFTNYVTNILESRVTERAIELIPRYVTNVVNVPGTTNTVTNFQTVLLTNTIVQQVPRTITNLIPSLVTNTRTNYYDVVITNAAQAYDLRTVQQTNLVAVHVTNTNTLIREVTITNAVGELILRAVTNNIVSPRTNYITNIIDRYVTNAAQAYDLRTVQQTNLVAVYVTNTNTLIREVTITNAVGELILRTVTNNIVSPRTNYITNIIDRYVTAQAYDLQTVSRTNLVPVHLVSTNTVIREITLTNAVGELAMRTITNYNLNNITRVSTNIVDRYITNTTQAYGTRTILSTNLVPVYITNTNTVVREVSLTNRVGAVYVEQTTNRVPVYYTNYLTNITEQTVTSTVPAQIFQDRTITNTVPVFATNYITNINERIVTNAATQTLSIITETNLTPIYRTNNFTNIIDAAVTNTAAARSIARDVTNLVPVYLTNLVTNIVDVPLTNTINRIFLSNITVTSTNLITNVTAGVRDVVVTNELGAPILTRVPQNSTNFITNVSTNRIDAVITNTEREITLSQQTNTSYVVIPSYTNVNSREFVVTNVFNRVETNFIDEVFTNIANPQAPIVTTNAVIMVDPGTGIPTTNLTITSNTVSYIEPVPIALGSARPMEIEPPQLEPLQEPVFEAVNNGQIIAFQDQQVVRLQQKASTFTEKASSMVGGYQYSEARGYVVRIAQVSDLAVANLIVKEIAKADASIAVGIFYRDEMYYLEVRNIRGYEEALELSQRLYKMGYTDTQIFERYELTKYTTP